MTKWINTPFNPSRSLPPATSLPTTTTAGTDPASIVRAIEGGWSARAQFQARQVREALGIKAATFTLFSRR